MYFIEHIKFYRKWRRCSPDVSNEYILPKICDSKEEYSQYCEDNKHIM